MRILYIHQFFATRESELGLIRSYEFSRRWTEQGHEVHVVTSDSRLPAHFSEHTFVKDDIDGIHVRSVRVRYSNYMGYARRIWSFLQFMLGSTWLAVTAPRPDVVFATSTPLTVGFPGWVASRLRGAPLVFEVRDLWPEAAIQMGAVRREGFVGRSAKWFERFIYKRSKEIVALSPGMVDGVEAEGFPAERVHMVPNCSDLDLFHPGEKDAEMVAKYGLASKFVVGYTGAVGPSNALEDSVPEAARILKERGRQDIVFLVAGEGKSLPLVQEAKNGLELDNLLLIGSLAKKDVPRVTRTADVLLTLFKDRPILYTNSPNKFFDGLATGKPMIVNSPGWTKALVEENEAGLYVPPGDGQALADAVERLAGDADEVARMGANARKLAEREFSRDDCAEKVLSVLRKAAGTE